MQLTWKDNYKKAGELVGFDLVNHPKMALDLAYSTKILVEGMTVGLFTGKKLSNYFNDQVTDPIGARKIINGRDKAELIAGYYEIFLDAIIN